MRSMRRVCRLVDAAAVRSQCVDGVVVASTVFRFFHLIFSFAVVGCVQNWGTLLVADTQASLLVEHFGLSVDPSRIQVFVLKTAIRKMPRQFTEPLLNRNVDFLFILLMCRNLP